MATLRVYVTSPSGNGHRLYVGETALVLFSLRFRVTVIPPRSCATKPVTRRLSHEVAFP